VAVAQVRRAAGPDRRYFRPQKDPCADISAEESGKDFTLYEKCDKQRQVDGDAGLVGYSGRCETENPGEYAWLPGSYNGLLERYAVTERIVETPAPARRRFFIYDAAMGYEARTGVYEVRSNSCKFYPTCSEYALGSIEKHGWMKGVWKSTLRIAKCNPWNKGGVDLP